MHSRSVNALVKEKRNRIEFELTESVYKRAKCERAHKDTKTVHTTNDKQTCAYKAHNHQINNPYNH